MHRWYCPDKLHLLRYAPCEWIVPQVQGSGVRTATNYTVYWWLKKKADLSIHPHNTSQSRSPSWTPYCTSEEFHMQVYEETVVPPIEENIGPSWSISKLKIEHGLDENIPKHSIIRYCMSCTHKWYSTLNAYKAVKQTLEIKMKKLLLLFVCLIN